MEKDSTWETSGREAESLVIVFEIKKQVRGKKI